RGYGASGCVGQPAVFPFRGCAEDRPGRHLRRLCALHLVESDRRLEQSRNDGAPRRGRTAARPGRRDRLACAALPGGWGMARPRTPPRLPRRSTHWGAFIVLAAAVALLASTVDVPPAAAQMVAFPPRP